jgi:hypothetical protein
MRMNVSSSFYWVSAKSNDRANLRGDAAFCLLHCVHGKIAGCAWLKKQPPHEEGAFKGHMTVPGKEYFVILRIDIHL